jgi:hypothetical protein
MRDIVLHWLIVMIVVLTLVGLRKIPEVMRKFWDGRGGGPPTHPLPVTSPFETSNSSGKREKVRD